MESIKRRISIKHAIATLIYTQINLLIIAFFSNNNLIFLEIKNLSIDLKQMSYDSL